MATSGEYALLCLENPLLDISAKADESLLKKYGLKANDAILASEEHYPLYEDLLTNHSASLIAGGGAQNTARGAQYQLPAKSVVYLGGVGNDKYADILRSSNTEVGLRCEYRVDETEPTGRCGVVITGHNRSLCTQLGAANKYDVEHLKSEKIWPLVQQARLYFVGGYHLTVCPEAISILAKEAAEKDKTFMISLSAPFVCQFFKEQLDQTKGYWDIVIGNETEARTYSEASGWGTTDVKEIAKKLASMDKINKSRKRVAIITQGMEPTVVSIGGKDVKEYPIHAIDSSQIVDTTGAGDAFAAGVLAGLIKSEGWDSCIDRGMWLAKLCIQQEGPVFPTPEEEYKPSSS